MEEYISLYANIALFLLILDFILIWILKKPKSIKRTGTALILDVILKIMLKDNIIATVNFTHTGANIVTGLLIAVSGFLSAFSFCCLLYDLYALFSNKFSKLKISLCSEENNSAGKSFIWSLIPSAVISYTLCIFGTYELFFANINDWQYTFSDILVSSVVIFAVLFSFCSFASYLFYKKQGCNSTVCCLTAVLLLFYVQNAGLNRKETLDGSPFATDFYLGISGALNLILWFAVIITVFILSKRFLNLYKKAAIVSGILLAMQITPIFAMIVQSPPDKLNASQKENVVYDIDSSEQFAVSSDENVMIFIMDTFSNKDMDYIVQNGKYQKLLSDFIICDNVSTETYKTPFSMPCLLTASYQDYSIGMVKANENCWNSSTAEYFYSKLHQNGYKSRLYTDEAMYSGGAKNMLGKIDNIKSMKLEYQTDKMNTYLALMSLSLYRYMPDMFKYIWFIDDASKINRYTHAAGDYNVDYSNWKAVSDNSAKTGKAFYNNDIIEGYRSKLIGTDDKLCTFMHIWGMHQPYYKDDGFTEETYDDAINDCMTILSNYVDLLKENGTYNNSTIIVTADHGEHQIYGSPPAMIIKPKNHTSSEYTVNTSPAVLQTDLLPTILDCLDIETGPLETSILKLSPDLQRERCVKIFDFDKRLPPSYKISAIGNAEYNCYYEYRWTGTVDDLDLAKEKYGDGYGVYYGTSGVDASELHPMADFWW